MTLMNHPKPNTTVDLRQRAEKQLKNTPVKKKLAALASVNLLKLVHELQVHQVELEMQNQSLLEAQQEISRNLQQLTELYELAPVAYFTLDRNGQITKSNAMGRKLLGSPILALDDQYLSRYVSLDTLPAYIRFFEQIFAARRLESCNLTLLAIEDRPIYVFMEGVADDSGQECRLVVTDMTRQRLLEQALVSLADQTE
jgi:PAS domain-containing protein